MGSPSSSPPAIRVHNAPSGSEAVVIVSCLAGSESSATQNSCHPNKVVWTQGKMESGVASASFDASEDCRFKGLMVQRVAASDVRASLEERRDTRMDPCRKGYAILDDENITQLSDSFDLSAVRLCFQVFLKLPPNKDDGETGTSYLPLNPLVSGAVRERVNSSDTPFQIKSVSHTTVPADRGQAGVVVECERRVVPDKDDVEVKLEHRDENTGARLWSCTLQGRTQVQVTPEGCIKVDLPPYKHSGESQTVNVKLYLFRRRDRRYSRSYKIQYVANRSDQDQPDDNGSCNATTALPRVSSAYSINSMPAASSTSPVAVVKKKRGRPKKKRVIEDEEESVAAVAKQPPVFASPVEMPEKSSGEQASNGDEHDAALMNGSHGDEGWHGEVQNEGGDDDDDKVELEALREENRRLRAENEQLRARSDVMASEEERRGGLDGVVSYYREDAAESRIRAEGMAAQVAELRAELRAQSNGLSNLLWQLEQKEKQVVALEQR